MELRGQAAASLLITGRAGRKRSFWWAWIGAIAAVLVAVSAQAEVAPTSAPGAARAAIPHDYVFPRRRQVDGFDLVLNAPQIRSWPGFERFAALMAVEVTPPGGGVARYATATVQGSTEVDLANRVVRVIDPQFTNVEFAGGDAPAEYRAAVQHASRDDVLEIPLDLFLASVADDVLSDPPPPGFNVEPPAIAVRSKPTLLLFVDGAPVGSAIADTGLEVLVNANWPVFHEQGGKARYFLLNEDRWYTSKSLEKGWKQTHDLPEGFARLPDEPQYAAVRAALPAQKVSGAAPAVLFAATPTELVVTDGKTRLEEIPGTGGLAFVANTDSPLFKLDDQWFYLAAGRWFTTRKLDKGPWTYTAFPPDAFKAIPADHAAAEVRASVPGTVEAKMAALEALVPTRVTAGAGAAPPVTVDFAGEPKFEPIASTGVSRAVNTRHDVLQVDGRCYLLYGGIWYEAAAATGPWTVAASVPDAIYTIPPSSPAYHMTQVTVVASTPETVTYSYPSSYSSSTYVVYGVPYYGTGWYYAPWIYGVYYYPYWPGYGYGNWNGNGDRVSHNERFNPRTGISTVTDRSYDSASNTSEVSRTRERGDQSITTDRTRDFDNGTSTVERETSRGGSSESQRERTADGISSEGSITTAGGREIDVSSEQSRGQGSSTITGENGSVTTETRRQNGQSITSIEGSGGGQGVSVSGDNGRTTIGQSGSGDIYAGHNGNVYKKTEDGWQHYDNGGWQDVEPPKGGSTERGQGAGGSSGASAEQRPAGQDPGGATSISDLMGQQGQTRQSGQRDANRPQTSELNRDYEARQRSQRQYEQRRSASQRGGYQQRGGGYGGMGGGGFRGGAGRGGGRRR